MPEPFLKAGHCRHGTRDLARVRASVGARLRGPDGGHHVPMSHHDGPDAAHLSSMWAQLLVDALATYRLTRLATADVISEPVRMAVLRKTGAEPPPGEEDPTAQEVVESMKDPPRLATLITCRWCAGMWIAVGVTAARAVAPRVWEPVARGLALSATAVLLSRFEDD